MHIQGRARGTKDSKERRGPCGISAPKVRMRLQQTGGRYLFFHVPGAENPAVLVPAIDLRPSDLLSLPTNLESWTVGIGNLHIGYNLEAIRNETTVRGEFVRQVTGADMPEDEKRKVLVTGLRALDGRDDLEVT